MTEETKTENEVSRKPESPGPMPGESIKDYASRRLTHLKNSERNFTDRVNASRAMLRKAENDLVACQARINEMQQILTIETNNSSANS